MNTENNFLLTLNLGPCDLLGLKDTIKTFFSSIEANPLGPNAYVDLGKALYSQSHLDQAIKTFNVAISLGLEDANVYNSLGDAFLELSELEQARDAYEKAISIDSQDPEAYINLSRVYKHLSEFQKAVELCHYALKLDPGSHKAYISLGTILLSEDKDQEADGALKKAYELSPVFKDARKRLGIDFYDQGDVEGALKVYKRNSANLTKFDFLYYRAAWFVVKNNDILQDGLKISILSIKSNPRDATAWFTKGFLLNGFKEYQKGIGALTTLVEINERFPYALNSLAEVLIATGKPQEGIAVYKRAILIDSNIVEAYFNLGIVYHEEGQCKEAINAFKNVLRFKQYKDEACYMLALIYFEQNDLDGANRYIAKAIQLNAKNSMFFNLRRELLQRVLQLEEI